MIDGDSPTRVLLLVEDNPADADLVVEYLQEPGSTYAYEVFHATRIVDAVERLRDLQIDVVLLDLRLPDSSGASSVQAIREAAGETPIVVLTGADDEDLALSCIHAGAQDYLFKSELRPTVLRRSIGYAITRIRDAQVRELQQALERYRALSSSSSTTSVTASLAGIGPLRDRVPEEFGALIKAYAELLEAYISTLIVKAEKPREIMEWCVTQLGDRGAGPRDLIDVHVAALDDVLHGKNEERSRALLIEGRLLALEMMGLLVDYYRIGGRRRAPQGPPT